MILMIDNYDSFTYNLVQYLGELGERIEVRRNDAISMDQIKRLRPNRIVISPGPGSPCDAGISNQVIRYFGKKIPLLGVCLGHQCIGYAYGGMVSGAGEIMHGKTSLIHHDGKGLFAGLPNPFEATRYHSLIVPEDSLTEELELCAWTEDSDHPREMMGFRHREFPVHGVQFHPESFLCDDGFRLLENFLNLPIPEIV